MQQDAPTCHMQQESHAQDVHQIFHVALITLVVTVTVSDKSNLVKVLLIEADMRLWHLLASGVCYCVLNSTAENYIFKL